MRQELWREMFAPESSLPVLDKLRFELSRSDVMTAALQEYLHAQWLEFHHLARNAPTLELHSQYIQSANVLAHLAGALFKPHEQHNEHLHINGGV